VEGQLVRFLVQREVLTRTVKILAAGSGGLDCRSKVIGRVFSGEECYEFNYQKSQSFALLLCLYAGVSGRAILWGFVWEPLVLMGVWIEAAQGGQFGWPWTLPFSRGFHH